MGIPKLKRTKFNTYEFVKKVNDNLFLYQNIKTGVKTTFNRHDLNMIDNSKIDKFLQGDRDRTAKIIVYDKENDTECEFVTQHEVADYIGMSYTTVHDAIKNKEWISKRYFVEYKEVEDERD